MPRVLFLDRFGELNYMDAAQAYVSCFQEQTRLVIGTNGWDLPRAEAEDWVLKIAAAKPDTLLDLRILGSAN